MPSYYFDTSALAKRYVVEVGSSWVQAVVAQQSGQMLYTSVLTQPEIVSALQRRVREGILEADQAQQLAQHVLEHMTQSYALATSRGAAAGICWWSRRTLCQALSKCRCAWAREHGQKGLCFRRFR